jgi:hypothetical protein
LEAASRQRSTKQAPFKSAFCQSPRRTREFDAPDGAFGAEGAFGFEEAGGGGADHPEVGIGGLFADDGGDDAGDAAEFDFGGVFMCLVGGTGGRGTEPIIG